MRDAYFGLLLIGFLSITSASELRAQSSSTAAPPPVASRIAPPGVYYLTQRASAKTPDSIRGYPPGTRVTLVEDRGEHLAVRIDDLEFDVKPDQVTNDLEIARRAWQTDIRQQQQLAAQAAAAEKQQAEQEHQRQIAKAAQRAKQEREDAEQDRQERLVALQEQAVQQQQAALERQQAEAMAAKKEMDDLRAGVIQANIIAQRALSQAQDAASQTQETQHH